MPNNKHSKLRDLLHSRAETAVIVLAMDAANVRHNSSSAFDSRISIVETHVEGIDDLRKDVNYLSKNVHNCISEISAERRLK